MDENGWLDSIIAIADILTPILLAIFTVVGWKFRRSIERKIKLEEKLHDYRTGIYNTVLEPFIIAFMTEEAWQTDPKNKDKDKDETMRETLLSLDYKRNSFHLTLIGSDSVVQAYNTLMQSFYKFEVDDGTPLIEKTKKMAALFGSLLLAIRKSLGNEATKLDHWDMLEWHIKDIEEFKNDEK